MGKIERIIGVILVTIVGSVVVIIGLALIFGRDPGRTRTAGEITTPPATTPQPAVTPPSRAATEQAAWAADRIAAEQAALAEEGAERLISSMTWATGYVGGMAAFCKLRTEDWLGELQAITNARAAEAAALQFPLAASNHLSATANGYFKGGTQAAAEEILTDGPRKACAMLRGHTGLAAADQAVLQWRRNPPRLTPIR